MEECGAPLLRNEWKSKQWREAEEGRSWGALNADEKRGQRGLWAVLRLPVVEVPAAHTPAGTAAINRAPCLAFHHLQCTVLLCTVTDGSFPNAN